MLKSVEETTLLTKLEELVQLAKKKKNVLEYKEIMDHLADLDLDPDRIDRIYEYLESQNIDILGNIEAEEEVEKELDLTLPEGINIDDPVRMYLKEIGKVPLLKSNWRRRWRRAALRAKLPRRNWQRPTCVWLSALQKDTLGEGCSFLT